MAFDDQLAERIRQHLGKRRDVTEKKMKYASSLPAK